MPVTSEALKVLNFGPLSSALDGFASGSDLVMVVGSGRADHSWTALETPLAEQPGVSVTTQFVTDDILGEVIQVSKYTAVFTGLAAGKIREVGLKSSNGIFVFIESLTTEGHTPVEVIPDYSTETVAVELVIHRVLPQHPITLYQSEEVTVEFLSMVTSDGNTPFWGNNSNLQKVVYRRSDSDPYEAYTGKVDVSSTITETAAGIEYLLTVLMAPEDEFYNPFTVNQLKELWIGTDAVGMEGVIKVVWNSPQTREPEMFWKVELPLLFKVSVIKGGT